MITDLKTKIYITRGVITHLFLCFMCTAAFVQAQDKRKIVPELGFGYRHSYLGIVNSYNNPFMLYNSDQNIRGINGSAGFKLDHFPFPKLSFRYRLHARYDYIMDEIDYLNLMHSFGRRLILYEKWGWLFDHRIGIYKTYKDKWEFGVGLTAFNMGHKNKQNLPPDNSQQLIYSIQVNCVDLIIYRKIKNWFDIGLISSYTLNGLPDHLNGKYGIFELQLSKSFSINK